VDTHPVAEDGPDLERDAFEVSDAEHEADRDLAIQLATAALTGTASLAGAVPGAPAAMFAPLATAIMTAAVQRLGRRRTEHAADTLMDAADAAGLPLGEFMDAAGSDDRRHELFARSMRIAQDTALRDKRRALGHALAAGVMGDDARIDEEMLFMRAIDDLDEMHIRLLGRMDSLPSPPKWTPSSIVSADPGLAAGVGALLGALELHGMIMHLPGRGSPGRRSIRLRSSTASPRRAVSFSIAPPMSRIRRNDRSR
jgi:hypothetical protein